jgi:hypothetical protein
MKKILFLLTIASLLCVDADAQFRRKKKKKNVNTEQQEAKPDGFEVNGFARDTDMREVRGRTDKDKPQDGFGEKDVRDPKNVKKIPIDKKTGNPRNRDIETLMNNLELAKIQRPVFRGIMTEHVRDIDGIMSNEGMDNAEKNVLLKQVYVLRNKRLIETLNDEQYRKWLRIKDQDEFLDLMRPEEN